MPEPLADDGMVNWVKSEPVLLVFPVAISVPWLERLASRRTATVAPGAEPLGRVLTCPPGATRPGFSRRNGWPAAATLWLPSVTRVDGLGLGIGEVALAE